MSMRRRVDVLDECKPAFDAGASLGKDSDVSRLLYITREEGDDGRRLAYLDGFLAHLDKDIEFEVYRGKGSC